MKAPKLFLASLTTLTLLNCYGQKRTLQLKDSSSSSRLTISGITNAGGTILLPNGYTGVTYDFPNLYWERLSRTTRPYDDPSFHPIERIALHPDPGPVITGTLPTLNVATISDFQAGTLEWNCDTLKNVVLSEDRIGTVILWNTTAANRCLVKNLSFLKCTIRKLYLHHVFLNLSDDNAPASIGTWVERVVIENCSILGRAVVVNQLPHYLNISNLDFRTDNSFLDLMAIAKDSSNQICYLRLDPDFNDIRQIRLNYTDFQLDFEPMTPAWKKERIYQQLVDQQKRYGFMNGLEKADKEFKQFQYSRKGPLGDIQNAIDSWWWDYSYDKFKVITNSFKLFLIFVLVNIFFYTKLTGIYYPENFKALDFSQKINDSFSKRKFARRLLSRGWTILLYTAFIFWGVKLDLKELRLKRKRYLIVLLFEYIAGIICLAYIANYVISK